MRLGLWCVLAGVASAATACTVGPAYTPPAEPVPPPSWSEPLPAGVESKPAPVAAESAADRVSGWWTVFEDPVLDGLIERAAASNLTAREAAARIRESRARLAGERSRGYPTITLGAEVGIGRLSDNGALSQVAPPGGFDAQGQFAIGIVASWEPDLFGRVRSSVRAAEASLQASVEDRRNVYVVLFGDVAGTYAEVRTLQRRIEDTKANIELQRQTFELVKERISAGVATQLDSAQSQLNLRLTESVLPQLRIALRLALNRLALLLGEEAGALDAELAVAGAIPAPPPEVAVGIPADLLRRRPDVRAAEQRYASEQARIGSATADLYPRLAIDGYLGLESRDIGDVFESGSREWHVSAPLGWVAFDGGGLRSRVDVADARSEAALIDYERTVLSALAETENALTEYAEQSMRREQLVGAVAAARRAVSLVTLQYRDGTVSFQNVMDMQQQLLYAQNDLAGTEGRVAAALIGVYKSLGGGWESVDRPPEPGSEQ